jgi:hypothetical protein
VTFSPPGEDISLVSSIFRDFFMKKKGLDWGDLCRGQGERGMKRDKKNSIFFTALAACAVN